MAQSACEGRFLLDVKVLSYKDSDAGWHGGAEGVCRTAGARCLADQAGVACGPVDE